MKEFDDDDAKNWGNALNEAAWAFLEEYQRVFGNMPADLFNAQKGLVRYAIIAYADALRKEEK